MKKKIEFDKVFENGFSYRSNFYSCYYLKNNCNFNRIGIVVSKKLGNSVFRNYEKRLIREFFRKNKEDFINYYDLIILIKRKETSFLKKLFDFNVLINHIQKNEKK